MGKAGKEEALEEQRGWRELEPQTYVKLTAHAKMWEDPQLYEHEASRQRRR
jgi:hypothetical protein